jgi:hypothetical protein
MKQPLTLEIIMEMGQQWLNVHLARLPVDERLKGLKPQEVLKLCLKPTGETHA